MTEPNVKLCESYYYHRCYFLHNSKTQQELITENLLRKPMAQTLTISLHKFKGQQTLKVTLYQTTTTIHIINMWTRL